MVAGSYLKVSSLNSGTSTLGIVGSGMNDGVRYLDKFITVTMLYYGYMVIFYSHHTTTVVLLSYVLL